MKKLILALCVAAFSANAQTNNVVDTNLPPTISAGLTQVFDAIKSNTNLLWEVHGIYAPGLSQRWGAGVGMTYEVSQYTFASTRLEYIDQQLVLPMMNVGLQYPITIGSWFHATPFAGVGVGFPLSGMTVGGINIPGRANNFDPIAITSAGAALRLYTGSTVYIDLIGDIEKWQSIPQNEYRLGVFFHIPIK